MGLLDIVTIPEPVLRKKARKVTEYDAELQTLVDSMVETMRAAPGVGLAAPQVDVPLRVIGVEYNEEDEEEEEESENRKPARLYTIVNPEITRRSTETEVGTEGCLSIPGYQGEVERALAVIVKGFNRRGQAMQVKAEGWLARIFQHEIDHLDGVLFTDRASRIWKVEGQPSQVGSLD